MPSPTQGELFPEVPSVSAMKPAGSDLAPVWLQRLSLAVLVIFCFYIGILMAVLPWSPRYWSGNGWILGHPIAANWLLRGWVRGLISGIGLLDLWVGVSELLHYRDLRR
jgi:hypothetical protein